ncbi:hypothetical protein [Maribacter sp. 2307UL18-2]|uniref:hypothetical protein n=1 Tax=Maribacter sp. 2307UL18-2 TaxID=3386274 RepID=UPI0039BD855E
MKSTLPLEIYISDLAAIGFFLFFPAALFLVIAVILLIAKQKKAAKVLFIIASCLFIIAIGACGFGA